MPRSKNTNSFGFAIKTGAKHPKRLPKERTDMFELRGIQQEISDQLSDKSRRRVLAATGSGKSIAMQWLAVGDSADGLVPVVTFPKYDILAGFAGARVIRHPKTKERRQWNPLVVDGAGTTRLLVQHIRSGSTQPVLCCAATWVQAQKQLKDAELKRISLFVDESHHIDSTEGNRLHDSTMRVCAQPSARVTLATATWLRDDSDILSDAELKPFTTFKLPLLRYLQEVSFIESIEFRYLLTDQDEALKLSLRDDRPMMVFEHGGQTRKAKLATNRAIVKACQDADRTVLDLVDDRDLKARAARLREFQQSGKDTTDVVTALYLGNEGFDWSRCSKAFFTRPKNALGGMVQMIGRTLRKHDGKKSVQIDICVPPATEADQLKGYLQAVLATAVLGTLFQAPKIKKHVEPIDIAVDELKQDMQFVLEALPELATSAASGASEDSLRKEIKKHAAAFPQLQDPEVVEALIDELTKPVAVTKTSRRKDGTLQLNTAGVDQIFCPIELVRAVSHGIETCSGAATRKVLEQIRMQEFVSLEEFKAWCAGRDIRSGVAYEQLRRVGGVPHNLPSRPQDVYGVSIAEVFGTEPKSSTFVSLDEFKSWCEKAKIVSGPQYLDARRSGTVPARFPSNPKRTYKTPDSKIFPQGVAKHPDKYPSLPECRARCRELGVNTKDAYMRAVRAEGFHSHPVRFYGLSSWTEFFERAERLQRRSRKSA